MGFMNDSITDWWPIIINNILPLSGVYFGTTISNLLYIIKVHITAKWIGISQSLYSMRVLLEKLLCLHFCSECFSRFWNSNYVDMHVDVEIKLYRHEKNMPTRALVYTEFSWARRVSRATCRVLPPMCRISRAPRSNRFNHSPNFEQSIFVFVAWYHLVSFFFCSWLKSLQSWYNKNKILENSDYKPWILISSFFSSFLSFFSPDFQKRPVISLT